ncbi:endonuclease [Helicobacter brantae]|uniref:Deoxyribonuclease n=1 Tax=Helicobacter brantae TaxID=375927 RepID=A0A3D8IXW4_9HELI|nr:endonuclease [Helicobacter brantae]RDU69810.1 deoxyribonuclease [Helicobacter brantae]
MRIFIFFLFTLSLYSQPSFSQSKKLLKEIYSDNQYTFYCNTPYVYVGKNAILQNDGSYTPRNPTTKKGKPNLRTQRIEWEHIMPAQNFGKHLPCWREGGRKACQKDPTFTKMEADMHNLVPSIGEINGDRSNYRYAQAGKEVPFNQYGKCRFYVDFKNKRAYPRDEIKGDIARAYLYMSKTYNIPLSSQERKLMEAWDKLDPISEWEKEKNRRIEQIKNKL